MSLSSVNPPKAVCLFSGGLDSTTVLYFARSQGKEVVALTIDYGQIHAKELAIATQHAKELGIRHYLVKTNFPWGGSALLDKSIPLAHHRELAAMTDIPASYVPARNTVLLALATSCAESIGAKEVFIGVNHLDFSGYPDCRPNFIKAFESTVREGTKVGVEGASITIQTPLIQLAKRDIIRLGTKLNVPYQKTWSCYQGLEKPCGSCDACLLRAKGFEEAGIPDPLINL